MPKLKQLCKNPKMLKTCCCGKCTLRTGTLCAAIFFMVYRVCLVAALAAAFVFFDEIDESLYYRKKDTLWVLILVCLVVNAVDLVLSVCLTIGVACSRSLPVLLWIVYEMINLVFLVVIVVVFMILTQFRLPYIVAFGATLALSAFQLYLILAVVSYYQYLTSGVPTYTTSR